MRGPIQSSRRRFAEYFDKRKRSHAAERIAARSQRDTDERDKAAAKRRKRSFTALFRSFWGLLAGKRLRVVAALFTLSIATALGLAVPYSSKIVIDYVLTDSPGPSGLPAWLIAQTPDAVGFAIQIDQPGTRFTLLVILGLGVLLFSLLAAAFGIWGRWQCTKLTKRLQAMLRRRAFDHAVNLPLSRISDLKSGGVASILREDAGNAGELLFSMIYNPWRAIIQLGGTLIILTIVDWRLLAGALVFIPIVWVSHRTWIARIRPIHRDVRATRQGIDAQATESFGGIRVVRGFHRTHAETGRFTRDNHLMMRQELLAWWWSRLLELAWQVLIPLASAGVLIYGGSQVLKGKLTLGDLMAFSAYVLMLLGPLEALVATASQIQSQLAGFDRTLDLFEEPLEFEQPKSEQTAAAATASQTPPRVLERERVAGRIVLTDVSFQYPVSKAASKLSVAPENGALKKTPSPEVLTDISFIAEPGETIALVGPSGSGKTTLCNLIARFYDPTAGSVTLDGIDLRDIQVDSYRRLLGIVEQDVFLFDGTIGENIAYARRDASIEEIINAADIANAHAFISEFEAGYQTPIGERGVRLSGGQKQRIAIARAVLADPKILILDEATSSLDSESERLIQASLDTLMQNRTSFVIAHRLSTIRHADRIIVLEKGRIVEMGTHDQLAARSGRYADLLSIQLGPDHAAHPTRI